MLNIYSQRISKTSTNLLLPLPAAYTEDTGTMTDITYPPNEVLILPTSPSDRFSNTTNYSPRQTTGSVFNSALSYPQGSAMTNSPTYLIDSSPHDTQHHVSLSSQISKENKSTTVTTTQARNFSPPVETTDAPIQVASRNSPSKEEMLRLEELQHKEAENKKQLKEEEEKMRAAADEKRLEEEKKKQILLARLKAIDESHSVSSQSDTKPMSHLEDTQPVKKKRLEDILNDGEATKGQDELVVSSAAKPFPSKSNSSEEKHKKDLLAQLLSTDEPANYNTQQTDAHQADEGLNATGSNTSIKSTSSTGSNYKWNSRIENMHQGKPALSSKDDPFGKRGSASLQKDDSTSNSRTSRKQNDGGLDFLGGTGGVINTDAYHSKKKDIPTFGRRAVQKPHAVFGIDLTTKTVTPPLSHNETIPTNNNNHSSKLYPWEQEVSVTNEHSKLDYLSHSTAPVDSSLLPRRTKAQPLNIGSIPGQIDDDIEELSLV